MAEVNLDNEQQPRDVATENVQLYTRHSGGRRRTAISETMLLECTTSTIFTVSSTISHTTDVQSQLSTATSRDATHHSVADVTFISGKRTAGSHAAPSDVACEHSQLYIRKPRQATHVRVKVSDAEVHIQSYEYVSSLRVNVAAPGEGHKPGHAGDGEQSPVSDTANDMSFSNELPQLLPGSDYDILKSPSVTSPDSSIRPKSPGFNRYMLDTGDELSLEGDKDSRWFTEAGSHNQSDTGFSSQQLSETTSTVLTYDVTLIEEEEHTTVVSEREYDPRQTSKDLDMTDDGLDRFEAEKGSVSVTEDTSDDVSRLSVGDTKTKEFESAKYVFTGSFEEWPAGGNVTMRGLGDKSKLEPYIGSGVVRGPRDNAAARERGDYSTGNTTCHHELPDDSMIGSLDSTEGHLSTLDSRDSNIRSTGDRQLDSLEQISTFGKHTLKADDGNFPSDAAGSLSDSVVVDTLAGRSAASVTQHDVMSSAAHLPDSAAATAITTPQDSKHGTDSDKKPYSLVDSSGCLSAPDNKLPAQSETSKTKFATSLEIYLKNFNDLKTFLSESKVIMTSSRSSVASDSVQTQWLITDLKNVSMELEQKLAELEETFAECELLDESDRQDLSFSDQQRSQFHDLRNDVIAVKDEVKDKLAQLEEDTDWKSRGLPNQLEGFELGSRSPDTGKPAAEGFQQLGEEQQNQKPGKPTVDTSKGLEHLAQIDDRQSTMQPDVSDLMFGRSTDQLDAGLSKTHDEHFMLSGSNIQEIDDSSDGLKRLGDNRQQDTEDSVMHKFEKDFVLESGDQLSEASEWLRDDKQQDGRPGPQRDDKQQDDRPGPQRDDKQQDDRPGPQRDDQSQGLGLGLQKYTDESSIMQPNVADLSQSLAYNDNLFPSSSIPGPLDQLNAPKPASDSSALSDQQKAGHGRDVIHDLGSPDTGTIAGQQTATGGHGRDVTHDLGSDTATGQQTATGGHGRDVTRDLGSPDTDTITGQLPESSTFEKLKPTADELPADVDGAGSDVNAKLSLLQECWADLQKQAVSKELQLQQATKLQERYDKATASITNWLDCIKLQALSSPDTLATESQLQQLQSAEHELKNFEQAALSSGPELGLSNVGAMSAVQQALRDVQSRLVALEEQKRLHEQQAEDRKLWTLKLEEELSSQEVELQKVSMELMSLEQFNNDFDTMTALTDRQAAVDSLQHTCHSNLTALTQLQSEVDQRMLTDPSIVVPAKLPVLGEQWQHHLDKLKEHLCELTTQSEAAAQYDSLLADYDVTLHEADGQLTETRKPRVDDVTQLQTQLDAFKILFTDLLSRRQQLDELVSKVDGHTRQCHQSQHAKLSDLASVVDRNVSSRQQQLGQLIALWHDFKQHHATVLAQLNDIESSLPQSADQGASMDDLREMLRKYRESLKALEPVGDEVYRVVDLGEKILQNVDSTTISNDIRELNGKNEQLTSQILLDTQRLETMVEQLDSVEQEAGILEEVMSHAKHEIQQVNALLLTDKPNAEIVVQAQQKLAKLSETCDSQKPHQVSVSTLGAQLKTSRPQDTQLHSRLQQIDDTWRDLVTDLVTANERLASVQVMLLPSTQARTEMLSWLDHMSTELHQQMSVQPKSSEDVKQLVNRFQLLKTDLVDHQRTMDYLNECAPPADQPGTAADSNINDRYRALAQQVDSHASELSQLLVRWDQYDRGVHRLTDWLTEANVKLSEIGDVSRGPAISQAARMCQTLEDALPHKGTELESVQQDAIELSQLVVWPADKSFITQQLLTISDKYSALQQELSLLKSSVQAREKLLHEYKLAADTVRDDINSIKTEQCAIEQNSSKDVSSLNSQLTLLKNARNKFRETKCNLENLSMCTENLRSSSDEDSFQTFDSETKQLISSWHSEQHVLDDKIAAMEKLEKSWSEYETELQKILLSLDELERHLQDLVADTDPEHRQLCLKQIEVLEADLGKLKDSTKTLNDTVTNLMPKLDAAGLATITNNKMLIDDRTSSLNKKLSDQRLKLNSEIGQQKQFSCDCKLLEEVLASVADRTEPEVPGEVATSDAVRQQLVKARDAQSTLTSHQPKLTQLSELGYRIPLTGEEADQLHDLTTRWTAAVDRTNGMIEELEHRLQQLQGFSDKCEEWSKYLASVERDLAAHEPTNYETLLKDQQVIQNFERESASRQQMLSSLLGEGHSLVDRGAASEDPTELRLKLTALEDQWRSVLDLAARRHSAVDRLLALWKDYHQQLDTLAHSLSVIHQDVDKNPVTVSGIDAAKQLLNKYQGLEVSLSDCVAVLSHLESVNQQLETSCDKATCQQLSVGLQNIKQQHQTTSDRVNTNIDKLKAVIQLWTDTLSQLDEVNVSLGAVQQNLSADLPANDTDLQQEASKLTEVDHSLSADDRLKVVHVNVDKLLTSASVEERAVLTQSMDSVDKQLADTRLQLAVRQQQVADRLRRWTEYDETASRLLQSIAQLDSRVATTDKLPVEDAVDKIRNEYLRELESLGEEVEQLKNVGVELKKSSSALQGRHVDDQTAAVDAAYSQLDESIHNRLKRLEAVLANMSHLEALTKQLRLWLDRMDQSLATPIVFRVANDDEIQQKLAEHQTMQADITAHAVEVAAVLELCESLVADTAVGSTSTNVSMLTETMQSLEKLWNDIKSAASDRKQFIEATGTAWQQFHNDHSALDTKLSEAESQVKDFNAAGETFDEIKKRLEAVKIFKQKTLGSLQSDVHKLTTQCGQLVRDGRADTAGSLQQAVKQSNERCDMLASLLTNVEQGLAAQLKKKKSLDLTREAVVTWLTTLDKDLTRAEKLRDKKQRARALQRVKKNADEKVSYLTNYDKAVDELASTCHALDAVQLRTDAQSVHCQHDVILKRLSDLQQQQGTADLSRSAAQPVDEIGQLEKSLDTSMASTSSVLQETMELVGEATGDSAWNFDLSELERWLKHANRVLLRLQTKPRELAHFARALALHQQLSDDIEDWTPRVADIRSSTHAIALQNPHTEQLCERISQAIKDWDSVCQKSSTCQRSLSTWLLISDALRLSIDNLLGRMQEARDGIVALDLTRSPSQRSRDENETMLMDLDDIVRGIDAMDRRVNRLAGLSDCLIYSSRPAVAEQQIEQLDAMANELTSMKTACLEYRSHIADAKPTPVDELAADDDSDDNFTELPSLCYRKVIPSTSTWAGLHHMVGGQATLSDKRCEEEQVGLLTGAEVPAAAPGTDSLLSRTRRSLWSRACRAAIPVQVAGFVFLGLAAFIPFCDFCDVPPNNFLYSLYPLLRYTDGMPPV